MKTQNRVVRGLGLAFAAMTALGFAGAAHAQQSWDQLVAAANKEGKLVIKGAPGKVFTEVFTEGFKKKYPGIEVSYTGLNGFETIPRVTREREAGIYAWDCYIGGTTSTLTTLKPAGAFVPLRPALMLPEVLDDKAWVGGFDFGWLDVEKKFVFGFDFTLVAPLYVNWDFVKPADLKTFKDLMKPEFADKIVWEDPRKPGAGLASADSIRVDFGDQFLTDLLSKQKIAFSTNGRQIAEWLVRGKYPIALGAGSSFLEQFWKQGLGKNVKPFFADTKTPAGGPGFGTISIVDKAPHPNAAKLYVNWLLSKEGQTAYVKSGRNSARLDVKPADADLAPKAGVTYRDSQRESEIPVRKKASAVAKKAIKG